MRNARGGYLESVWNMPMAKAYPNFLKKSKAFGKSERNTALSERAVFLSDCIAKAGTRPSADYTLEKP